MDNIRNFSNFKGAKTLNEDVLLFGSDFRIRGFDVPVQLINAFKKKAKDGGYDIANKFADTELAEMIAKYVQDSFLVIDNLPLTIVGFEGGVQVQPKPAQEIQTQVQPQTQIQGQIQGDEPTQTQQTAQQIPAQEGGQTQGGQPQGGQPQGGQPQGGQPQGGQI
jgi:hypothetical protein